MTRPARSLAPFAAEVLAGPLQHGCVVGDRWIRFPRDVLALTAPGALRMPNGIETEVRLQGDVEAGYGELKTEAITLGLGPLWNPRPEPRVALSLAAPLAIDLDELAGRGPGLTPLGDDVLIGYLAASSLSGRDPSFLARQADRWGRETTALSRTLLRLAARGHLPEAAHPLLVSGDPRPLLGFGSSSGNGIAFGLALAGVAGQSEEITEVELSLPWTPEIRVRLVIGRQAQPWPARRELRAPRPLYEVAR